MPTKKKISDAPPVDIELPIYEQDEPVLFFKSAIADIGAVITDTNIDTNIDTAIDADTAVIQAPSASAKDKNKYIDKDKPYIEPLPFADFNTGLKLFVKIIKNKALKTPAKHEQLRRLAAGAKSHHLLNSNQADAIHSRVINYINGTYIDKQA